MNIQRRQFLKLTTGTALANEEDGQPQQHDRWPVAVPPDLWHPPGEWRVRRGLGRSHAFVAGCLGEGERCGVPDHRGVDGNELAELGAFDGGNAGIVLSGVADDLAERGDLSFEPRLRFADAPFRPPGEAATHSYEEH